MIDITQLLYFACAAWYVSYVVSSSSGPFNVFIWIRAHLPLGGLTHCIICLMPWVALILSSMGRNIITDALAIAGVGLWFHGFTSWRMSL